MFWQLGKLWKEKKRGFGKKNMNQHFLVVFIKDLKIF